MWLAEGAVGAPVVPLFARHGIRWIVSDVLCQPYRPEDTAGGPEPGLFFRHGWLSDLIGFHYHAFPDAEEAAASFVSEVHALASRLRTERDHLVTVVLDGKTRGAAIRTTAARSCTRSTGRWRRPTTSRR